MFHFLFRNSYVQKVIIRTLKQKKRCVLGTLGTPEIVRESKFHTLKSMLKFCKKKNKERKRVKCKNDPSTLKM